LETVFAHTGVPIHTGGTAVHYEQPVRERVAMPGWRMRRVYTGTQVHREQTAKRNQRKETNERTGVARPGRRDEDAVSVHGYTGTLGANSERTSDRTLACGGGAAPRGGCYNCTPHSCRCSHLPSYSASLSSSCPSPQGLTSQHPPPTRPQRFVSLQLPPPRPQYCVSVNWRCKPLVPETT